MESADIREFNIPEENTLLFQALDLNKATFENNLKIRLKDPRSITGEILADDKFIFKTNENVSVCSATWDLIAIYSKLSVLSTLNKTEEIVVNKIPEKMLYNWTWSWIILPEERNLKIKEYLSGLPLDLYKGMINLNDPMVISYLLAFVSDAMKFEHIYVHFNGENYSAFGLKNIQWLIEPDSELIEELDKKRREKENENETNKTNENETNEKEGKIIDWNKLFDLYAKTSLKSEKSEKMTFESKRNLSGSLEERDETKEKDNN